MRVSSFAPITTQRSRLASSQPTPPQDPDDGLTPGEEDDIKRLLKNALPAAYAGGGIGAVAGAMAGYSGGFVGGESRFYECSIRTPQRLGERHGSGR